MIPFPRRHLLTDHGVLAPASSWRNDVAEGRAPDRRYRWAELMKRTFGRLSNCT